MSYLVAIPSILSVFLRTPHVFDSPTELRAAAPQSHRELWLFLGFNGLYGAIGSHNLPANDALTGVLVLVTGPGVAKTHVGSETVLGRQERDASLQKISANANKP